MQRLTKVNSYGGIEFKNGVKLPDALKILAEYEDTGMTPAEIVKLKKELFLDGTYICGWGRCD